MKLEVLIYLYKEALKRYVESCLLKERGFNQGYIAGEFRTLDMILCETVGRTLFKEIEMNSIKEVSEQLNTTCEVINKIIY